MIPVMLKKIIEEETETYQNVTSSYFWKEELWVLSLLFIYVHS